MASRSAQVNFALKLMNLFIENDGICIKNDEFSDAASPRISNHAQLLRQVIFLFINDEFFVKIDEFFVKNDEFCN